VAVTAAVKIARAEAVATPAPQQRKALPAELGEERRKVPDDQRKKPGDRMRFCEEIRRRDRFGRRAIRGRSKNRQRISP
jgi:hypothetical protein